MCTHETNTTLKISYTSVFKKDGSLTGYERKQRNRLWTRKEDEKQRIQKDEGEVMQKREGER